MRTKEVVPSQGPKLKLRERERVAWQPRSLPVFQAPPPSRTWQDFSFFFSSLDFSLDFIWNYWGLIRIIPHGETEPRGAKVHVIEAFGYTYGFTNSYCGQNVMTKTSELGERRWHGPKCLQKQVINLLMCMISLTAGHPDVLENQALASSPRFTPDCLMSLCLPGPQVSNLYRKWTSTCLLCGAVLRFGLRVKENSLDYKSPCDGTITFLISKYLRDI